MQDTKILNKDEILEKLKEISGWKYASDKISKTFIFSSFKNAVAMVNDLQPFCDEIDHHPDIHIYYKKITFDLQRHDIGEKVTERDFTVAKEIEKIYNYKYKV
jgi:4a-hydroxytetrahydrobiopterin dehydratase